MFRWLKQTESSGVGPEEDLRCSFCGKPQKDVRMLVAGPAVFICDECVDVCVDIIGADETLQDHARVVGRSSRSVSQNMEACALCGTPAYKDLLAVENRGGLCGACADAVEDALARGFPAS